MIIHALRDLKSLTGKTIRKAYFSGTYYIAFTDDTYIAIGTEYDENEAYVSLLNYDSLSTTQGNQLQTMLKLGFLTEQEYSDYYLKCEEQTKRDKKKTYLKD